MPKRARSAVLSKVEVHGPDFYREALVGQQKVRYETWDFFCLAQKGEKRCAEQSRSAWSRFLSGSPSGPTKSTQRQKIFFSSF
jgi:hypothetical protein